MSKQTNNLIEKTFKKWLVILGLADWRLKFEYIDSVNPASDALYISEVGKPLFFILPEPFYLMAKVQVYLPNVNEAIEKGIFEELVIHEVLHLVISPLVSIYGSSKELKAIEELVVTKSSRALANYVKK